MPLTLDQANTIIAHGFEKAKALGLKPLCIAVLDPGGHVISLQREDGASTLRPQIGGGKASGALALGMSSRRIGEMAVERPSTDRLARSDLAGRHDPGGGRCAGR